MEANLKSFEHPITKNLAGGDPAFPSLSVATLPAKRTVGSLDHLTKGPGPDRYPCPEKIFLGSGWVFRPIPGLCALFARTGT